jgi:hypothetical protein
VRWQDVPSRDEVGEVMQRPEFQYPRSIMERIGDWIGDRLDDLFGRMGTPDVPSSSFGGGVGSLVGWLLVFVAVVAVVVVIVVVLRNWIGRTPVEEEPLSDTELEHRRRAREWAGDAERHEARGEWKLAMRARLRELVRTLTDRHQVVDLAGRTTGELRADLAVTTPDAHEEFDTACLLFELPWYADVPTGEAENRRFKQAAARVLGAEVQVHAGDVPAVALAVLHGEPAEDRPTGPGAAVGTVEILEAPGREAQR